MSEIPNHGNRSVTQVGAKTGDRTEKYKWGSFTLKALIQPGEEENCVVPLLEMNVVLTGLAFLGSSGLALPVKLGTAN